MDVKPVEVGGRSTLWIDRDGGLYRHYHDTDTWDGPRVPRVDDRGVLRAAQNRRVDDLVREAFDETTFRGAARPAPPHLRQALARLTRGPRDVDEYARLCGVQRSTAWCYAARVVERWPAAHALARALVHPPVLDAVAALGAEERKGSLRALMDRVLRGDHAWRCVEDRFAHLRLARLCVQAAEGARG